MGRRGDVRDDKMSEKVVWGTSLGWRRAGLLATRRYDSCVMVSVADSIDSRGQGGASSSPAWIPEHVREMPMREDTHNQRCHYEGSRLCLARHSPSMHAICSPCPGHAAGQPRPLNLADVLWHPRCDAWWLLNQLLVLGLIASSCCRYCGCCRRRSQARPRSHRGQRYAGVAGDQTCPKAGSRIAPILVMSTHDRVCVHS